MAVAYATADRIRTRSKRGACREVGACAVQVILHISTKIGKNS